MEDVLMVVAEYLYTKTLLSFRTTSKIYYSKINLNDILLNKYTQRITRQSFLNAKYLLQSICYPYRLVRQTNGSPREEICKYRPYQVMDSKRRGPEELYKTNYKEFK
jgi:hypothetical protein